MKRFWATVALVLALPVAATAQTGGGFCGPEVPQSAFGNPTFWKPNMTFTVMTVEGGRVLMAEGGYGDNEAAALGQALAQAGDIDEVWLSSPGGNMDQGMEMGRLIHSKGLAVRVPAGHACISSCSLAFLGGALRTIDPGAYYGIHMFSSYSGDASASEKLQGYRTRYSEAIKKYGAAGTEAVYQKLFMDLEQSSAMAAAGLARYLIEMSASLDFLTGMSGQQHKSVCYVTRLGMKKYNVVNVE